jgi:TRAP-type C4-dicarboxylate transport system permease large subunit
MFVILIAVMGGIYLGIATPTEAAAIGTLGSFLFIIGRRRLTLNSFVSTLIDTGVTTGMLLTILIGAMFFSIFLSITGLPMLAAEWITGLEINKYLVLGIVLAMYIPLGCVMDSLAMIVLTIPLFFPTLKALGFSPILLGILAARAIEIGQITPPVGLNVFIIRGIVPEVPLIVIFRGILPFFFCDLIYLAVLVAVPQISLFLPNLMK